MADLVIQNPSITTSVFEYDDAGRVSAISGHPLAGEGGGEIVKSDLMWKPTVGADGYVRWTLASSASEPDAAYISGAQGPAGQNGTNGDNGADGISPTFTITPTAGGTHVVLSGAQGEDSFDVLSGAKGADGTAGFSPTVSTTTTATEDRTGTVLTFTYGDEGGQTISYTAWNGKDGTGATVDLLEGTGIQITHTGTTYTIGVSADYLQSVSVAANGSLAGSGTSNSPLSLKTSAEQALAAVDGKMSKPQHTAEETYWVWESCNQVPVPMSDAYSEFSRTLINNGLGLSADYDAENLSWGIGIDSRSMTANKQYAFTTTGWEEVVVPSTSGYLPLSGGTVSGQLEVHGGSNFDQQFLKLTREGVTGHARLGLGQYGALALKADDNNSHTTQVNISPNTTNDQLVQVQHGGTTAYLIPAITATTTAGLTNDGILHIILES